MVKHYLCFICFFFGCTFIHANAVTIVPEFTPISPICMGSAAPVLPTLSNNGITGIWSPATISNTASGSYVFTPADGQDASAVTITVTVMPNVVPNFAPSLSMMPCGTPPVLQMTSPNGITGTWSPAEISNSESGMYTFTPNAGQCASVAVMTVTINDLNLHCDPFASNPNLIFFDFANVGQNGFELSYTIDGGAPITFIQQAPSSYGVPIVPGQVVTMTVTAIGVPCISSQTVTCQSLTVADNENRGIAFYPNPVSDFLILDLVSAEARLEIHNAIGQAFMSKTVSGRPAAVDLSGLPAGVYMVTVNSAEGTETFRIIKR